MDFHPFVSSSKDFTIDFSMSHCYARYRSEEISPIDLCMVGENGASDFNRFRVLFFGT